MRGIDLVAVESELTAAMEACRSLEPDAAIIDISFPHSASIKAARWLVKDGYLRRIAFLDDRLALLRAHDALSIKGAIYFTRDAELHAVCNELRLPTPLKSSGNNASRSGPTLVTNMAALKRFDNRGITDLTAREKVVLAHLAEGYPVKEIARMLNLADSTVDNHKSRIMKKLDLHRGTLLARIAIESGLVD
jgi:DNA-binding NarL/FixJ family response regulator